MLSIPNSNSSHYCLLLGPKKKPTFGPHGNNIQDVGHLINGAQCAPNNGPCSGYVEHEWIWDRNYVWLLHSYGNLCSWLHNYSLTLLLSMQASPFSYHELNTNNTKTIQNQKFKSLHNSIPSNFAFIQQFCIK
jgi:hypothetical protein